MPFPCRLQSMSSPSASSLNTKVFFSFTMEDVEVEPFILILHKDLRWSGIQTCFNNLDDVGREKQKLLRSDLGAIERSKVSIVVFSEHYAGFSWCLQELEKIMECHRATGQMVLPVFFGVDRWDVRKQSGRFGEEFERMIKETSTEEDTVLRWRRALTEVAFFLGCFASPRSHRDTIVDNDAIDGIVDTVHMLLGGKYLSRPLHPVGIDVHVKGVCDRLKYNLKKVHLVGIWGKGGIGKTSVANFVYDSMCHNFEGSSFLANIKDVWKQDNGKDYLQKQLSDINNTTNVIIHSNETEKMFSHKRALVVLDDVSDSDQLISLCGSCEWFGDGSIILITTREKNLLDLFELQYKNVFQVDKYEMKEMDTSKSLELFSWHAFKHFSPADNLIKLSRKAISYCGGLPLALEVLGSLLLDRTTSEWKSVLKLLRNQSILKILKRNQSKEVIGILKMSYDFLDDDEKKIFIEIACYYIGMDRHRITQLLNGCGLAAETGISKLIERSLLKVDKNNKLEMHDLLQNMGREMNHLKSKSKWIYDVFFSFRGADTRRSFTSHLCAALQNTGIEVYMDDKLERGGNISSSLLQAIEDSRISIIIFSINYANSR